MLDILKFIIFIGLFIVLSPFIWSITGVAIMGLFGAIMLFGRLLMTVFLCLLAVMFIVAIITSLFD